MEEHGLVLVGLFEAPYGDAMDRRELVKYVRSVGDGVVSTLAADGSPQAAYVSLAVTEEGELLFDAHPESRKVLNLGRDPRIAVVVGGRDDATLQCEGVADLPEGAQLDRCTTAYLATFPQFAASLEEWAVLVRVTPGWARWSDYRGGQPVIEHVDLADGAGLTGPVTG